MPRTTPIGCLALGLVVGLVAVTEEAGAQAAQTPRAPTAPNASAGAAGAPQQAPAAAPADAAAAPQDAEPAALDTPGGPPPVTPPEPEPEPEPEPLPDVPPPPPSFPGAGSAPAATPSAPASDFDDYDYEEPPEPPEPAPDSLGVFGLSLHAGFAVGGDEVVSAEFDDGEVRSLDAGTGALLGIGIALTPLRIGPHALGIGVDQAVKFDDISASNASIALTRFPLVVSLDYSLRVARRISLVIGGGLVHEYGISIDGSGDLSDFETDIDDSTGWMGEAGVGYTEGSVVVDITLRYTALTYRASDSDEEADASSGGLVVAGHYFF